MRQTKMVYIGGEQRYFPGLGRVLDPGDTVNVPSSEADSYLGLFEPAKSPQTDKGRLLPGSPEKEPDA